MNRFQRQVSDSHVRKSGGSVYFNLSIALLLWAAPMGATADDLAIQLVAQRVEHKADGSESFQPATQAKPGDIIEYTAQYKNQSNGAISNLQPVLPIPAGMEYISDSAKPAPVAASLDGKKFLAIPLKRKVKLAGGEVQERKVPASEYRALQWRVGELPANKTVAFSARVRIPASGPIPIPPSKTNAE